MKTSLDHEFYKLLRQSTTRWAPLVLFALQLYTALPVSNLSANRLAQGLGAGQWVIIIMIVLGANLITGELRHHTLPLLLAKSPRRSAVYLAKALVGYLLGAALLALGLLLGVLLAPGGWGQAFHQRALWQALLLNGGRALAYLFFALSLALLLAVWLKNSATVIITGLAIAFFGAPLANLLLAALPGLRPLLVWNPLNMINVVSQLGNGQLQAISGLTNLQLLAGDLAYGALFLLLGGWLVARWQQ